MMVGNRFWNFLFWEVLAALLLKYEYINLSIIDRVENSRCIGKLEHTLYLQEDKHVKAEELCL